MPTLNTIEKAAELHASLNQLAPCAGAIKQKIMDHGFGTGAANQAAHALEFQTLIAAEDIAPDDTRYNGFVQGFHCIEIIIRAEWGGYNHDRSKLIGTKISVHILDRLEGVGMCKKSWSTTNTMYGSELIDVSDIHTLVSKLLAANGETK